MAIIVTILVAITLIITNINPITAVRDNFFIFNSQASTSVDIAKSGQVMGASETSGNNSAPEPAEVKAALPIIEAKPAEPVLKSVYRKAPEVAARSAMVIDVESQKILYEKNSQEPITIASITKLVTALAALKQSPNFNQEYVMQAEDRREGGRINLFWGDKVTIKDLWHASLVGSDNTATIALVHALGFNEQDFVARMNQETRDLSLRHTNFVDPIGLSTNNKSTSAEVAKIAAAAFAHEEIRQAVTQPRYILRTKQGKTRIIESTDDLLGGSKSYQVLGGKTGSLGSAGFSFTGKFSQNEREIISVVLGSNGVDTRFADTDALVNWA
ncbi:MAG: serine hydrolase [Patescibacteria group bacterium]